VNVAAEANEQRPVEGMLIDHLERIAGCDPSLGQEAEHVGI
jgi:hypothetical protein